MKLRNIVGAILFMGFGALVSCKGKSDADIQTAVSDKISSVTGVTSETKDGVVTLSGTVEQESSKTSAEDLAKSVEGVKSVTNNITVTPAPVEPVTTTPPAANAADEALTKGVNDLIKDFPGAQASVQEGVITITGELKADKWTRLKKGLDALNPKSVNASGLTVKK